ncbi:hypothetical protein BX600DRAFT_467060 [Xylariales sp. PMI_506]|nr:hypothetical protein BX600DRAFT_467060 [Xylariales sp. PMI_506]
MPPIDQRNENQDAAINASTAVRDYLNGVNRDWSGAVYIPSPTNDLLINVVSSNVFAAFMSNVHILGYDGLDLFDVELISPFSWGTPGDHLPPDMMPTAMQLTIPHHPAIDIFPDPKVREQMILWEEMTNTDEFCCELAGLPGPNGENEVGVIVWGAPHQIGSWEVTETFFQKWRYLLGQCEELIQSSNRWRAERGEEPLVIDVTDMANADVN